MVSLKILVSLHLSSWALGRFLPSSLFYSKVFASLQDGGMFHTLSRVYTRGFSPGGYDVLILSRKSGFQVSFLTNDDSFLTQDAGPGRKQMRKVNLDEVSPVPSGLDIFC